MRNSDASQRDRRRWTFRRAGAGYCERLHFANPIRPHDEYKRMNFQWAMDRLRENKRVRRASWPRETIAAGTKLLGGDGGPDYVVPKTYTLVWHLFMMDGFLGEDFWESGIINGWGGSIGGAADDDPVRDGMVYLATDVDRQADDWERI